MYHKKSVLIVLVGFILLLEGCSRSPKVKLNSSSASFSSSCRESVAPYSLESLERDYVCKKYKEGA